MNILSGIPLKLRNKGNIEFLLDSNFGIVEQGFLLAMADQLRKDTTIPLEKLFIVNSPSHLPIRSLGHSPTSKKGKHALKHHIEE